ncbi:hypothetical protein QBC38DRAFT_482474 [Podospora fimiseda]|uniref:C2H2-type domain-containing protein n=1 Tax=Podospora fimiseda TaxID=252190 RepID=A0AAN7BLL8_9PEZI|nr:hypothetical protein QBC38DRAFT_482474 [Podospora fimiseda]
MNSRKDSWDSTSTIIGPAVSEYQPHSSVKQPTSRQVTDQPDSKYRPKSRKGGSRLQLPSICIPCNFEPKKGPDQRKKMERHMKTARHREKVGEEEKNLEEYLCEMCQRIYNRRDNFRQHQKACRHRSLKIELANEDEEFELENQETTSRRTSAAYGHDDAHGDASGRLGRCLAMDEGEGIFSMSSF